jgi:hypothetical protein
MRRHHPMLPLAAFVLTFAAAGCSSSSSSSDRGELAPVDLARRAAAADSALATLTPACTTMTSAQASVERCVYVDDGVVRCVRTTLHEPKGVVGETSMWYQGGRPWRVRHVRHQPMVTPSEPWHESTLEAFFDAEGRVVWAGQGRDEHHRALPPKAYAWLETNLLAGARRELETESARRGFTRPAAGAPAGP